MEKTVHKDSKEVNGFNRVSLDSKESEKVDDQTDSEEDNESKSLLPPKNGGMPRPTEKPQRKVQWNDKNGNKLAEVLEFTPSDASDSDDEESDSCICTIM